MRVSAITGTYKKQNLKLGKIKEQDSLPEQTKDSISFKGPKKARSYALIGALVSSFLTGSMLPGANSFPIVMQNMIIAATGGALIGFMTPDDNDDDKKNQVKSRQRQGFLAVG